MNIAHERNPAFWSECKTRRCVNQSVIPGGRCVRCDARLRRLRARRNDPWRKYCWGVLADLEKVWATQEKGRGLT